VQEEEREREGCARRRAPRGGLLEGSGQGHGEGVGAKGCVDAGDAALFELSTGAPPKPRAVSASGSLRE
jgi:hypothetical protein